MNFKRTLAALVLAAFGGFTAWILVTQDNAALLEALLANLWSVQVFLDLCIASCFAAIWVVRDARAKGVNPWPWLAMVVPTGSLALLAYAVVHGFREPAARGRLHSAAA